jgi:hypothetical protein
LIVSPKLGLKKMNSKKHVECKLKYKSGMGNKSTPAKGFVYSGIANSLSDFFLQRKCTFKRIKNNCSCFRKKFFV